MTSEPIPCGVSDGDVKAAASAINRLFIERDTDAPMPSFEDIAKAALAASKSIRGDGWQKGFAPVELNTGEILIAHASLYEGSAQGSLIASGLNPDKFEVVPVEFRTLPPAPTQEG